MPTYNRAHLVDRATQSVLKQTYKDFELIIVDDGSTDNTEQIIKSFEDPRIIYIKHKKNLGGSAARNTGIKNAKGKYLAFLDSDDEWLSQKLEVQIDHFVNSPKSTGLVYSPYYVQDDSLDIMIERGSSTAFKRGNVYMFLLSGWCPSITSSVMIPKKVFKKSGLFDENLQSLQDYDFWIRIAKYYRFDFVNEFLVVNHHHLDSRIGTNFTSRIKGLNIFIEKWGNIIKKEVGTRVFDEFYGKRLFSIYSIVIRESLQFSEYKEALKYLRKIIKIPQIPIIDFIKVIMKSIIFAILRPRIFFYCKTMKFKILECFKKILL